MHQIIAITGQFIKLMLAKKVVLSPHSGLVRTLLSLLYR